MSRLTNSCGSYFSTTWSTALVFVVGQAKGNAIGMHSRIVPRWQCGFSLVMVMEKM